MLKSECLMEPMPLRRATNPNADTNKSQRILQAYCSVCGAIVNEHAPEHEHSLTGIPCSARSFTEEYVTL